jgi:hypothetical protein
MFLEERRGGKANKIRMWAAAMVRPRAPSAYVDILDMARSAAASVISSIGQHHDQRPRAPLIHFTGLNWTALDCTGLHRTVSPPYHPIILLTVSSMQYGVCIHYVCGDGGENLVLR